jgi:hypothetical protein
VAAGGGRGLWRDSSVGRSPGFAGVPSFYIFEAAGYAAPILSERVERPSPRYPFPARFCMHRRADFYSYLLYFHNIIRKIA